MAFGICCRSGLWLLYLATLPIGNPGCGQPFLPLPCLWRFWAMLSESRSALLCLHSHKAFRIASPGWQSFWCASLDSSGSSTYSTRFMLTMHNRIMIVVPLFLLAQTVAVHWIGGT